MNDRLRTLENFNKHRRVFELGKLLPPSLQRIRCVVVLDVVFLLCEHVDDFVELIEIWFSFSGQLSDEVVNVLHAIEAIEVGLSFSHNGNYCGFWELDDNVLSKPLFLMLLKDNYLRDLTSLRPCPGLHV